MDDVNAKLERFFNACADLIEGKFILADSKIGELLRSIAASEDLTRLFAAVTKGFDYPAAKRTCLRGPDEKHTRGEAFLPATRGEVLAFVFCLLVELDSGALKLNDFLLRYFYEDGSFTASYSLFVTRMIRPFRDIVRECFPLRTRSAAFAEDRLRESGNLQKLSEKIAVERERIKELSLSEENAAAGETILNELYAAAGRGDVREIKALLCGYLYFLQTTESGADNSNEIFLLASEL